jgi:RNA polymerase sigma-70 factor (ECF subfamily)
MNREESPLPQPKGALPAASGARGQVLARLAQNYGRALHRFFERRVNVKADVPDLVQDVYLRLSRMADPAGSRSRSISSSSPPPMF